MSENDKDPRPGEFTDPTASPDWTAPESSQEPESATPPTPEVPQSAPTEQIPQGSDEGGSDAESSDTHGAGDRGADSPGVPPVPPPPSYDAPYAPPHGDSNPYAGSSAQPTNPYAATLPPPPHDPYGSPQPSYDPYAASGAPAPQGGYPAYQAPGQWQAPPPAYGAPRQQNTSALVLTILSGLALVSCCNVFMIVSLVLGIMGLTKNNEDPEGARRLTKWGWVAFAVSLAILVIGVVIFIALGAAGAFDSSSSFDSDYSY